MVARGRGREGLICHGPILGDSIFCLPNRSGMWAVRPVSAMVAVMLAFIMWHRPRAGVDRQAYMDQLVSFHRALNAAAIEGMAGSVIFEGGELPWVTNAGALFEDWYLLEDSAALDRINAAAVAGRCQRPHDGLALDSTDEAAGLYRHRSGDLPVFEAFQARWIDKPADTKYEQFLARLEENTAGSEVSIWTRQMGLSPAPEFCVLAGKARSAPSMKSMDQNLACLWSSQSR